MKYYVFLNMLKLSLKLQWKIVRGFKHLKIVANIALDNKCVFTYFRMVGNIALGNIMCLSTF